MTEVETAIYETTVSTIITLVQKLKTDPRIPTVTKWAQENRFLPSGTTEHPGLYDPYYAPYTVEIQEAMHPDSPIRVMSIMKSTQSMGTTTIENAIGHSIRYGLHNVLYVISDLDMAKMRSTGAIDVLIDFGGLQEFVKPMTKRDNQRKSGDTILYKEFSGGRRFLMTSYNSIAKLKSFAWDFIIMDEIDEAPFQLKGQGDPEAIIEKRGQTIRDLKICKISTPSNALTSRIYRAYKTGTRSEYVVPCPRCGGMQHLEVMRDNRNYGLYGEYTNDEKTRKTILVPGSARYKCKLCEKDFYEYERREFMLCKQLGGLAYWMPTSTPQDPRDWSIHISAMMSPMTEWSNIVTDYLKTDFGKKIQDFKNHVITNEGLPYISNAQVKPYQELIERVKQEPAPYQRGTVPPGALVLYGHVDVQKNRTELQVVAYGEEMESWSIDHQVFFGETANINSPAWADLAAFCDRLYHLPDLGVDVRMLRIGVDVSYNPNKDPTARSSLKAETNAAYQFCKRNGQRFLPIKGQNESLFKGFLVQQKRNQSEGIYFYLADVSAFKDETLSNIDLLEGPHAIHFPQDYDDEYYRQFLSEILATGDDGKTKWEVITRDHRNETWDTFIGCRVVAEIHGITRYNADDWETWREALRD